MFMQHTDSTAPLAKAQEAGTLGFGQASDMASFAPKPRISSIVDNWSPITSSASVRVLDGSWKSEGVWLGIGDGEVVIGEITDAVPAEIKAEGRGAEGQDRQGRIPPFTGPLKSGTAATGWPRA